MHLLQTPSIWFLCGSQHLYGPGPLRTVAQNAQEVVDRETEVRAQARAAEGAGFFADYRTNDEIKTFLDDLIAAHPDRISTQVIGNTIEFRA